MPRKKNIVLCLLNVSLQTQNLPNVGAAFYRALKIRVGKGLVKSRMLFQQRLQS